MAQGHPYHQLFTSLAAKQIDVATDTFKLMLLTSAYVPNLGQHQYQSDLTNELPAGSGYTVGGNIISTVSTSMESTNDVQTITPPGSGSYTIGVTIGNTTLTTPSQAFNVGASALQTAIEALGNVGPGNVAVAGTGPYTVTFQGSLGAQYIPLMTLSTGSVAHTTPGSGLFAITGGSVSWPASSFAYPYEPHYGVVVDSTPGSAATNPLVALVDFISDQATTNGTLSVAWDPSGIVVVQVS